ncbi:hypothetical protein G6F31_017069 [Rhizopus arrhizus]|nr:hypothetical protein G6F31_017069 [Rhizopus arrhizus]
MVITVKCSAAQWSLLDPAAGVAEAFSSGAAAFDAAVGRASAHHRRTGQGSTVRVEALGNSVEAVHFEALPAAAAPVSGLRPAPPQRVDRLRIDVPDLRWQGAILQQAQGLLGQDQDEQVPAQAADLAQQRHAIGLAYGGHARIDDQHLAVRVGDLHQNLRGRAGFAEHSAIQMGLDAAHQFTTDPRIGIGERDGGDVIHGCLPLAG